MKYYFSLFKKTSEAIEVSFPDLEGCVTFGSSWEEALNNAIDVLAAWLANAEPQFIKTPSSYAELEQHKNKGTLVPIPVDEKIMESYQKSIRINIILPSEILKDIDSFRKRRGIKRSTFLRQAAEEFLKRHQKNHHPLRPASEEN